LDSWSYHVQGELIAGSTWMGSGSPPMPWSAWGRGVGGAARSSGWKQGGVEEREQARGDQGG